MSKTVLRIAYTKKILFGAKECVFVFKIILVTQIQNLDIAKG
jgi:hypothetical protein